MPVVTDEELQEQIRLCPEHVNGVLHLLLEQFKTQIETWVLCKEPMENIKFDEAMHVVNGPGYNLIQEPLQLAGVTPATIQAILTSIYRDWMFAVDLEQPQVARQILEVSPKQFESIRLAYVCVRWWWPLLKQLTALRWQRVRELVRTHRIAFFWWGLVQVRLCAEGGRGRAEDCAIFRKECGPSA